ncbi:unnamed protein product [Jaminaea pallidilutea]
MSSADDDGLMLNFSSAGPGPSRTKAKAKPPQPRQQQSNAPQRLNVTTQPQSPQQQTENGAIGQKRQRSGAGESASAVKRPRPTSQQHSQSVAGPSTTAAASSSSASRPKPSTFISSLFSGGPALDVAADDTNEDDARTRKKVKPTNAPADTSTFSGLGLDPLLVAHLASKRMNIGERPTGIQRAGLPTLLDDEVERDAFVHAQTGSGKTLTYLLPILQSLLPLSTETWIDRSVGTLAIILAPTRELARQIYEVAEKLCQLHLSLKEAEEQGAEDGKDPSDEDAGLKRRTRWLVPGLLSGGSTKNHEKSRLRKGIPILVATPGRLLDHLQNTSSFDVGKCRWLVLDEADRLLEMGFKETLEGILKAMDGRRRLACNTAKEVMQETWGPTAEITPQQVEDGMGVRWWAKPRRVVLCSATLDEDVQTLAGTHLRDPQVLRGGSELAPAKQAQATETQSNGTVLPTTTSAGLYPRLAAPAQLRQHAVVVPPKLRLVTLIALLRSALSRNSRQADARRVIVFMSCTDSVEFFWHALGGVKMGGDEEEEEEEKDEKKRGSPAKRCDLFPTSPIFRLHGSLPQAERIASLKAFSAVGSSKGDAAHSDGAVLFCTSVAARGLDLPSVGCVVQLDPPTEGGVDEYLHRIGRTARVGREGESWIMFLPHEREARVRLEAGMQRNVEEAAQSNSSSDKANASTVIADVGPEVVLKRGFGGRGDEYESRATEVQLAFERFVLKQESASAMARRAFLSHIRAYATHPANEKDLFHVRFLHLGHLAKSFALREAPDVIRQKAKKERAANEASQLTAKAKANGRASKASDHKPSSEAQRADSESSSDEDGDLPTSVVRSARKGEDDIMDGVDTAPSASRGAARNDAEARMYAKVRQLGRNTKSGGLLGAYGADEFQIG